MSGEWQRRKGIMLAYPFEEKRLAKWQPPYVVQPKYDGVRCRAVPLENGEFLLLSSEENTIFSVPHINKALSDWQNHVELDGELYCHGMSFEEIVSRTARTINLHSDYESIQFYIFDEVVPEPQMDRTLYISEYKVKPPLVIAPFWICYNLDDIMRAYDKIISLGYEGIIVRHHLAPYIRRRSTYIMKFKPKQFDIYNIIGATEEISKDGIPKGRLGALICKSDENITFQVGTGLTDEMREILWKDLESLTGKKVKIAYQDLTDRKVPRFPVYVEVVSD